MTSDHLKGEIEISEIKKCTLFLIALTSDPYIDVPTLNRRLSFHYTSLILQGVGYSERGVGLSGGNSSKGMRVSSSGQLENYIRPRKVIPADVAANHLSATSSLVAGLHNLYSSINSGNYWRLRKGLDAFFQGFTHNPYDSRLHQFIRSID